jgi:nucleotide-binding universal stress UspA family protein
MARKYKIVVGFDFDVDGDLALDTALDQVAKNAAAEVHAIFVDRPGRERSDLSPSMRTLSALQQMEARARERIAEARSRHPDVSFGRVVTHYRVGDASIHIVRLASDLDADCIVVGTHDRRGLDRLMQGSVSEDVVHSATCPVIVARPKKHQRGGVSDPPQNPAGPTQEAGR